MLGQSAPEREIFHDNAHEKRTDDIDEQCAKRKTVGTKADHRQKIYTVTRHSADPGAEKNNEKAHLRSFFKDERATERKDEPILPPANLARLRNQESSADMAVVGGTPSPSGASYKDEASF